MFIITTAEIRWFYKGVIPKTINSWFENLDGLIEQQDERIDLYLMIKDTGSIGIKFREERFELKQKSKDLGILEFSPNISGNAELWKKWSFESRDNTLPLGEKTKGEWIEVVKARKLQKFIFDHKGKISLGFDNYRSDGCNVELTKVIANKNRAPLPHSPGDSESPGESQVFWWTLGLETYG
ncbi:MAG: hypothetical protein K8S16_16760, partial [Bacteroidales bacterium]|nr:hypothetical protein [Bacteroidales bacterium]